MKPQRRKKFDLSSLNLEELHALVSEAKRLLAIRRFEEDTGKALQEYQTRDRRIIRL